MDAEVHMEGWMYHRTWPRMMGLCESYHWILFIKYRLSVCVCLCLCVSVYTHVYLWTWKLPSCQWNEVWMKESWGTGRKVLNRPVHLEWSSSLETSPVVNTKDICGPRPILRAVSYRLVMPHKTICVFWKKWPLSAECWQAFPGVCNFSH
jgi:hypothetical protein